MQGVATACRLTEMNRGIVFSDGTQAVRREKRDMADWILIPHPAPDAMLSVTLPFRPRP